MNRTIFMFCALVMLSSCREQNPETEADKKAILDLPSEHYNYVDSLPELSTEVSVYVPIYSDIFILTGKRKYPLTATLSVRNTSMKDSMFVRNVDYYSSKGKKLRSYIDSTLLLTPLESVEFIVSYDESKGGAGANFIINWAANNKMIYPVIEAVMIGYTEQQGISFLTQGVVIARKDK